MKWFSEIEFRRCVPACHMADMDAAFLAKMDEVREVAGIPLVLNSAFRTQEQKDAFYAKRKKAVEEPDFVLL